MIWLFLLLTPVLLVFIKLVKVSTFWHGKGIPYESFSHYLYRILWAPNTQSLGEFYADAAKRYGRVFGTYKGLTPTLVTMEVEIAKDVLVRQFENFFKRSFEFKTGEPVWDNNLFNQPHDQWKTLRAAIGHAFTTAKMKDMITKFDVMGKRLTTKFKDLARANGNHVDSAVVAPAKMYSIDSTMAIAYGKDTNCIENPNSKLIAYATTSLEPGLATFLYFVAPELLRYVPGVSYPAKATTDFFGLLARQIFKEKRAKLDDAVANGTTDIIDRQLLLQREDPTLTDEILTSQAFLFVVAGVDFIALGISLTMYYMALYPHVQQKAFEELKSVLGGRKEVTHEDILELKYLEGCILESYRIFPFAGSIDRICTKDTVVRGIRIEKGMRVAFMTNEMMQCAEYFPEPSEFRPERFMKTEFGKQQELGAFLLFGDGPKNCVGKRLAMMNSLTALANLILELELETCPETPAHPPKVRPGFNFDNLTERPLVIRIRPR